MRRVLITIISLVTFGFGSVQAQDAFGSTVDLRPDYYIGTALGLNGGSAAFFLHFGINDLITDGVGTRFSVGYHGRAFGLGADVIANLPVNTQNTPVGIYAGAGLGVAFYEKTNVNIGVLVGAEYRFENFREGGLSLELGPAFSITGHGTAFNLKGGFNYHF